MDQNMTHRGDQRGKGHDKRACAYRSLEFHPEEGRKNHQHHHTAACAHKAGAKTYGQAEEQGDRDTLPVQFFAFTGSVLPAGIRLYQKANADEKCQKEREASQYDVADKEGRIAPNGAHAEDAHQHDPPPPEINVFMFGVCIGGYR